MAKVIHALLILKVISFSISKLAFAFEIFRHGARAPTELDQNNLDYFKQKWAKKMELTSIGLRQHYLLGVRNRERLIEQNKLLSDSFNPKEIIVISTDTTRTLNSASAQLQGLYASGKGGTLTKTQIDRALPPNDPSTYNEEKEQLGSLALPNQIEIIPIHTIYAQDNDFFLYSPTYCSSLKKTFEENNKRQEMVNLLDRFNEKYEKKICNILDKKDNCINHNLTFALNIFETIHAEYIDNRDMTIFSNQGIKVEELVKDCIEFAFLHLIGKGIDNDKIIGQVGMSPTFKKIKHWMNKIIENPSSVLDYSQPKLVMVSAHDASIGAFTAMMKAAFNFEVKYPSFASNLFLELHLNNEINSSSNDYTVKYYFDDMEVGKMSYNEFIEKLDPLLMNQKEINEFCTLGNEKSLTILWIVLISVFSVINVVIIGIIIHLCFNKPKVEKYSEITDNEKTY